MIAEKQFQSAVAILTEAIFNVSNHDIPDKMTRISAVIFQCDVLKAAAVALLSEENFRKVMRDGG